MAKYTSVVGKWFCNSSTYYLIWTHTQTLFSFLKGWFWHLCFTWHQTVKARGKWGDKQMFKIRWLKTPTEPPGYSFTVFSYKLNQMLIIFTCQYQMRIQTLKMSWFSSEGQTFLKCCKLTFLFPVSHAVFSFEVYAFLCVYVLPNLFICFIFCINLHFILL